MEGGIVQNDHAVKRQFWNQIFLDPGIKDRCVNGCLKQRNRQKESSNQSANGVRPAFGSPIMTPKASFSFGGIPMGSRHMVGKPTFI